MKSDNYIRLELPSRSSNEAVARGVVAAFAAQLDPTLEELGDIKTAVSEAVTNCIVHAYPDRIGIIILQCQIVQDTLEIVVRDRAAALKTWSRRAGRSLPPAEPSARAWALPLWKAL